MKKHDLKEVTVVSVSINGDSGKLYNRTAGCLPYDAVRELEEYGYYIPLSHGDAAYIVSGFQLEFAAGTDKCKCVVPDVASMYERVVTYGGRVTRLRGKTEAGWVDLPVCVANPPIEFLAAEFTHALDTEIRNTEARLEALKNARQGRRALVEKWLREQD